MKTIEERISTLLDIEEIRQLRVQYAHCFDGNKLDGLDTVFAPDAVVDVSAGEMRGLARIKEGLADFYQIFDRDRRGHYPFFHSITNHQVVLESPDFATGLCYLVDFETASKQDSNPLLLLGLYRDEYRRIGQEWRIAASHLDVIWRPAPG